MGSIIGRSNVTFGGNNTITGNHMTINEDSKTIIGNHNKVIGNNNVITGNHNKVNGNHNKSKGVDNTSRGAHNKSKDYTKTRHILDMMGGGVVIRDPMRTMINMPSGNDFKFKYNPEEHDLTHDELIELNNWMKYYEEYGVVNQKGVKYE